MVHATNRGSWLASVSELTLKTQLLLSQQILEMIKKNKTKQV